MRFSVKAGSVNTLTTDCVVVMVWNKSRLTDEAKSLDKSANKALSRLLQEGDFDGGLGRTRLLPKIDGVNARRILLLGGGDSKKFGAKQASKALRAAVRALAQTKAESAHFALGSVAVSDRDTDWFSARVAQECEDLLYRYTTTKSKKPRLPSLKAVTVAAEARRRKQQLAALKQGQAIGKAINQAKELGNLPGNICTPTYLAEQAKLLDKKNAKLSTKVLGERQMQRLGMNTLLSVAAGSAEEAKLIVMEYNGAAKDSRPYALVGKGITFDTGGISLKPGLAMDEMKYDMCGAASVIATMSCVAEMKLPINVVAIVAAAENMPSGKATKPGDIVTSMSGKTVEILNTDAEGRLVLSDALTYLERYKPRSVIDIATLTGAAVATFGSVVTALLSNNDKLAQSLLKHGEDALDPAWQLPLWDEYQNLLDSNFADIANIGGPRAGTITAACFLSRFTEKFVWAHLDIAGTAWNSGAAKGATGRPVPLLVEYLRNQRA